jgi:exopolysaccharide biosynthesis polyprenyl glycosylphosphotransferase
MAASYMRLAAAVSSSNTAGTESLRASKIRTSRKAWVAWDVFSVVLSAGLATIYRLHTSLGQGLRELIHGTLIPGRSMGTLLAYLAGFTLALILISRRMNLYYPGLRNSFLHEQRLSLQACLSAGLLLAGALYLVHADDIPRLIVVATVVLTAVALGVRRMVYRAALYQRLSRGAGIRNVLIVGVGPRADAVRQHLAHRDCRGYMFMGFIQTADEEPVGILHSEEIVGSLDDLFDCARRRFVTEIFLAAPCEDDTIFRLVEGARAHGIDLRVIPEMYGGLAWHNPVEYIGRIPTIPIQCTEISELAQFLKRSVDLIFSLAVLIVTSPLFVIIALAVKLDSPGPVFYISKRVGKKGQIFRCIKFRTMVQDAEQRLQEIAHLNERDGMLFKASNDPRITRLGGFLRKYSLDELPQFVNVLRGEMSIVGPRPALAHEVNRYELPHLRRLDVTPGITGLWQVQARQDPSFDSYVSLDLEYIDSWSPWLDFKIILRTIGVVVAGTGS